MRRRRRALLGRAGGALLLVAAGAGLAHGDEAAWEALRTPGAVVIVRHSYAPGGFDPPTARLDDCSTQRNLDETGRAQARRLGEAFHARGVAVGKVLSSPRCRCLDTGRLAFGRAEAWAPLEGSLRNEALRRRRLAEVRQRIAAHRDTPPLVLVTHGSVVSDLTGVTIRMGEIVVLRLGGDGTHAVAGRLNIE
jgi:broad specificity phosphatase PhoE